MTMDTLEHLDVNSLALGVDIGSTTVKLLLVSEENIQPIYKSYNRHETQQTKSFANMLEDLYRFYPQLRNKEIRVAVTGSGASTINPVLKIPFVQEVNAVAFAVEALHPEVNTVFELGGQDSKMILFRKSPGQKEQRIIISMNDKCASGTGATIDRCIQKLGLDWSQIKDIRFDKDRLHRVSAKCGVFAETDIVNLLKSSVPAEEILNSLADAIVLQNLSVLAKGNRLQPGVLLLGGPHYFMPFLVTCWQSHLAEIWSHSDLKVNQNTIRSAVQMPEHALYYAAWGAASYAIAEKSKPRLLDVKKLKHECERDCWINVSSERSPSTLKKDSRLNRQMKRIQVSEYRDSFENRLTQKPLYLGVDGGSTSSKVVLLDEQNNVVAEKYCLSRGNPLSDLQFLLSELEKEFEQSGVDLVVGGVGVTGYAAEMFDAIIKPDVNVVETVAHYRSAIGYFGNDVDVICDVGGQDIKIIFLKNGEIDTFRLSNQCSAGNGMLLQSAARQFGVELDEFSSMAFAAKRSPDFSHGCAVFLDSDRVNFQKQGYTKQELFAGLVRVLPKNIWQYVAQISRLGAYGRKFVLQGGVQKNLAAVKAQSDYIELRVDNAEVHVHPYCAEAGAIGAAMEARDIVDGVGYSTFIGLQNVVNLRYSITTDESTRCGFCDNFCARTFVDSNNEYGKNVRFISGYGCEKGSTESGNTLKNLLSQRKQEKIIFPNLADYEAASVFKWRANYEPLPESSTIIESEEVSRTLRGLGPVRRKSVRRNFQRSNESARKDLKIGIPGVLSIYQIAPFMKTYLTVLGVKSSNIIFSDSISNAAWRRASGFSVNDPCYPAKLGLAHVYHLIHAGKKRLSGIKFIWFPTVTHISSFVSETLANTSCPVVSGTPAVIRAALTKERDHFREKSMEFVDGALNLDEHELLKSQLYETWHQRLGMTRDENGWAVDQAFNALRRFEEDLQKRGRRLLEIAEENNSLAILFLGRPYQSDSAINHQVLDEFQKLGYPVLTIRSIPRDRKYLSGLFKSDLETGAIKNVFDINDVWPENFSTNSAQKVWAAKFAARHPNIAVVEMSSFKCGHDAPTYGIIDAILSASRTPHLALHDLDANKPAGTFNLRIRTFAYVLKKYQQRLQHEGKTIGGKDELEQQQSLAV